LNAVILVTMYFVSFFTSAVNPGVLPVLYVP
jgi:hypothetical protein